jgi:hypothetical protein
MREGISQVYLQTTSPNICISDSFACQSLEIHLQTTTLNITILVEALRVNFLKVYLHSTPQNTTVLAEALRVNI